jgi:cytochrome c553
MAPLIAALKKGQIPAMAAHFAGQTPARGAVENQDLASRGKTLFEEGNRTTGVPACVGCHMASGAGAERYPRLGGQRQAYTVQQLADFKSGKRSNDRARVMRLISHARRRHSRASVAFIGKPFTAEHLAQRVRETLDRSGTDE